MTLPDLTVALMLISVHEDDARKLARYMLPVETRHWFVDMCGTRVAVHTSDNADTYAEFEISSSHQYTRYTHWSMPEVRYLVRISSDGETISHRRIKTA